MPGRFGRRGPAPFRPGQGGRIVLSDPVMRTVADRSPHRVPRLRLRIALVEAIEATGFIAWRAFLKAATDYTAATGKTLRYFGPEHAALETGHAIGADDIDRELRRISLTPDERRQAIGMVDEVFGLFDKMLQEQLDYAQADRIPADA